MVGGAQLLGVVDILLALPLVGASSAIERIWTDDVEADDRLTPPGVTGAS